MAPDHVGRPPAKRTRSRSSNVSLSSDRSKPAGLKRKIHNSFLIGFKEWFSADPFGQALPVAPRLLRGFLREDEQFEVFGRGRAFPKVAGRAAEHRGVPHAQGVQVPR